MNHLRGCFLAVPSNQMRTMRSMRVGLSLSAISHPLRQWSKFLIYFLNCKSVMLRSKSSTARKAPCVTHLSAFAVRNAANMHLRSMMAIKPSFLMDLWSELAGRRETAGSMYLIWMRIQPKKISLTYSQSEQYPFLNASLVVILFFLPVADISSQMHPQYFFVDKFDLISLTGMVSYHPKMAYLLLRNHHLIPKSSTRLYATVLSILIKGMLLNAPKMPCTILTSEEGDCA